MAEDRAAARLIQASQRLTFRRTQLANVARGEAGARSIVAGDRWEASALSRCRRGTRLFPLSPPNSKPGEPRLVSSPTTSNRPWHCEKGSASCQRPFRCPVKPTLAAIVQRSGFRTLAYTLVSRPASAPVTVASPCCAASTRSSAAREPLALAPCDAVLHIATKTHREPASNATALESLDRPSTRRPRWKREAGLIEWLESP